MATIPLMLDQDVELGELPSYDEATTNADNKNAKSSTSSSHRNVADMLFGGHQLTKDAAAIGAVAYANISIRLGFLRKVLGILSFQLLLTTIFCISFYLTPNLHLFVQEQPWILLISIFGSFGLLIAVYMNAHSVPLNYILLLAWTACQSATVGVVVSFYSAEVVIEAAGLTALVVFGLFAYTLQSKRDFQKHWAALFSFLMIFICASFVQMFMQSAVFNFVMAVGGAILFSVYLIFDIDRITHHLSPEDYIDACISLYLDIINLFLRILQILGEMNRQ